MLRATTKYLTLTEQFLHTMCLPKHFHISFNPPNSPKSNKLLSSFQLRKLRHREDMTHPGHTATKELDTNPGPSDSRSKPVIHHAPQDSHRSRNQRRELRDNFLKKKKKNFFNEQPDETKLYLVSSPVPALNPQGPSPSPFF